MYYNHRLDGMALAYKRLHGFGYILGIRGPRKVHGIGIQLA